MSPARRVSHLERRTEDPDFRLFFAAFAERFRVVRYHPLGVGMSDRHRRWEPSAKAIQELAGHENLTTTQRYMQLSPAVKSAAIGLLNQEMLGDIRETAQGSEKNP